MGAACIPDTGFYAARAIKRVSQRSQAGLTVCTYGEFVALICGLDAVGEQSKLEGFREWLCLK